MGQEGEAIGKLTNLRWLELPFDWPGTDDADDCSRLDVMSALTQLTFLGLRDCQLVRDSKFVLGSTFLFHLAPVSHCLLCPLPHVHSYSNRGSPPDGNAAAEGSGSQLETIAASGHQWRGNGCDDCNCGQCHGAELGLPIVGGKAVGAQVKASDV